MPKEDNIEVEGVIINTLPGGLFEVKLPDEMGGYTVRAKISGKMRKNYISLMIGDTVLLHLTPYDLNQGRIVFRKK